MFLSVIIPVYNEEKVIKKSLARITGYLESKKINYEIIAVDDGSSDQSAEIIRALPDVKLVQHQKNFGKGQAVKSGMMKSRGDWCLFLDADLSTDISEYDKFIPYLDNYDIIVGTRQSSETNIIENQPFYRVLLGKFGNLLIRLLLGYEFKDTQCGFKIFNRRCLNIFEKQKITGWGFDFEIFYLAKIQKLRIKEVGINWRVSAHSNIRFKSYLETLRELIKLKLNIINKNYEKIHSGKR